VRTTRSRVAAAWVVTLVFVLPIYLALSNAFKSQDQITANPLTPPAPFTFDNIVTALSRPDHLVQSGLFTSVLVTTLSVGLLIPLASALSLYIFERTPKVRATLLAVFAFGLMVPPQVVLQPIVLLLRDIGLANSYAGRAIFLGLWVWNDFLNPLFILGPLRGQTITTGVYLSLGTYSIDYAQLFGIMFLAAVLPVVGYLVGQREFIHGLMSGAAK
jgi:raffinose/stachyose/melibiose transport system permease protein